MDKLMRALELSEQNAAEIAALKKRRAIVMVKGEKVGYTTSFGTVPEGFAIVVFDGEACALLSCGNNVVTGGSSPLIGMVKAGKLELSAARSNARAAIFR